MKKMVNALDFVQRFSGDLTAESSFYQDGKFFIDMDTLHDIPNQQFSSHKLRCAPVLL